MERSQTTFDMIRQHAGVLAEHAWNGVLAFAQPWTLVQFAIIVVLALGSRLGHRRIKTKFEVWLREQGVAPARFQLFMEAQRQLPALFFAILAGIMTLVMREYTWPSRSYLIGVAAQLTAIWIVVRVATRLIDNQLVGRCVAAVAWSWAALDILGIAPRVFGLMDALAIHFGQIRLSLLSVTRAALVMAILFWLAALASRVTEQRIGSVEDISPSMRVLVSKLVRVALFVLATMIGLQTVGFDLTAFAVFSGAIGLGLGFGLQKVVSNLVSGVILLVDKSIKPGDIISLGDTFGWISSLGARYVSVVTRDGREFLIPNEDLITNRVINWSYSNQLVRLEVPFGVSYESDPHLVRKIAIEAALTAERVHRNPQPVCHVAAFGDSSIDFVLRFWISDPNNGVVNIQGEVLLALWDAFKVHGVSIPFPQRDLHIKGPVMVPASAADQPASAYRTRRSSSSKRVKA